MRHVKVFTIGLAAASLFLSCSQSMDERDSTDTLSNSVQKASRITTVVPTDMSSWMSGLQDNISLSKISIPGTHDSGARIEIPSGSGTAKTQNLTIAEQLNAGVRFLDIRNRHYYDSFMIHHGPIYQELTFDDVLKACYEFLDSHPTETIIMSVKEEYSSTNTTRSFEETFDYYVQKNPTKWDLGNNIPKLGDIRGKIRLLRRFPATTAKGIDATSWGDNTTFEINNPEARLKVQDNYKVSDTSVKWNQILNVLNETKDNGGDKLFINFTSGYKTWFFIPNIPAVSNQINLDLRSFFQNNTKGSYGIIPTDFIDQELSSDIVKTNF
ncbi:phosphatidylinositol diacylglycerol-lyase [Chryseobacterium sp. PMSZPI]|nr:phosphatidylinositol diacylglycerol-lyase [Chryseobacterium sp. PMSZPI]